MTIKEAMQINSEIECDLLLAHVLKQNKEFLYLHSEASLTAAQISAFKKMVNQRMAGMPVAYILGYKYFYGLKIMVNRSVLIPRPETETLVDLSLKFIQQSMKKRATKKIQILDVGTGSGCIAIAIAKHMDPRQTSIAASDISVKALAIAKRNVMKHKAKVSFSHRNLLTGFNRKFDVIVANLPYVPVSNYIILKEGLKYEPKDALTDGTDVFGIITLFLRQSKSKLQKNGMILLETDPSSVKTLRKVIKEVYPGKQIKVLKDIHNLPRFITVH